MSAGDAAMMGSVNGVQEQDPRKSAWAHLALILLIQIAIFYDTYWSMVEIWWRSETFAHGFFILPISLFLIWRNRQALQVAPVSTDWRALVIVAGLGFGWMLARLTDVQVIQQLAVVAMLPVLVWLVLGLRAVWTIAFPLAFLLFAVPIGEFLIYPMMEFTASFTVNAVRLTGIPVYWEGMFFTLPSGRWSIVEGCSGVRYIIASITLGALYAYLTYHSYWRRAAFMLLAVMFPVIANGLRAYMIVMIGHMSSMKLATGVDHLVYGWVWFGIVMFIMFWLGSFWRDDEPGEQTPVPGDVDRSQTAEGKRAGLGVIIAALLVAAIWPVWAGFISNHETGAGVTVTAPGGDAGWLKQTELFTEWTPKYVEPTQTTHAAYQHADSSVGLYLAYYQNQQQGRELVNSQNVMVVQKHPVWSQPYQNLRTIQLDESRAVSVYESRLRSSNQSLLTWHWNYIGGEHLTNNKYAKALEAWLQLTGQGRNGTGIVIYTQLEENGLEDAQQRLAEFAGAMLPGIEQAVSP